MVDLSFLRMIYPLRNHSIMRTPGGRGFSPESSFNHIGRMATALWLVVCLAHDFHTVIRSRCCSLSTVAFYSSCSFSGFLLCFCRVSSYRAFSAQAPASLYAFVFARFQSRSLHTGLFTSYPILALFLGSLGLYPLVRCPALICSYRLMVTLPRALLQAFGLALTFYAIPFFGGRAGYFASYLFF